MKPHIRACLYAADQWCKAHQDHVGPAELVLLVSHVMNKNGVAGCLACQLLFCLVSTSSCAGDWVFTPLTKEYLSLGQGAGANAQRKKKPSHDLPHAKSVENVFQAMFHFSLAKITHKTFMSTRLMESQQVEVVFLHNWSYNAQVGRRLPMNLKKPYVQHGIEMGPTLRRVLRSKPVV